MTLEPASYPRHRFPAEIISHAVWLYHVFSLSLRDVELILAERGILVTHESIRQWCLKFGADFAERLRDDGRCQATRGTSTRCSYAFGACCITFGERWISTAPCWTFWCRIGGTVLLPSVSSSACYMGCSTSPGASSPTACAAMASLSERSCPMFATGRAGT
jgi:hypothetical protein